MGSAVRVRVRVRVCMRARVYVRACAFAPVRTLHHGRTHNQSYLQVEVNLTLSERVIAHSICSNTVNSRSKAQQVNPPDCQTPLV
jgi:hypothetical protein